MPKSIQGVTEDDYRAECCTQRYKQWVLPARRWTGNPAVTKKTKAVHLRSRIAQTLQCTASTGMVHYWAAGTACVTSRGGL